MEVWYSLPGVNEPLSSFSHLAGAVVFAVLSIFLLRDARKKSGQFWFVAVFAAVIVLQLALSSVYHMFERGTLARSILVRLDVATIFLVIAGTLTPLHGLLFRDWRRWGLLIPLWIVAIAGLALRIIFFASVPKAMGTFIFIGLGWLGIVCCLLVAMQYGWKAASFIAYGGVAYTIGGVSNALEWPLIIPYVWGSHETLHFCVLIGMTLHWNLVSRIVEGKISPIEETVGQVEVEVASQ